ncbi:MAG: hypothetical protein R3350_03650 [Saprospiraceae bacterium]|nr:hypothetical protein [Saprospiraceae bacterium]
MIIKCTGVAVPVYNRISGMFGMGNFPPFFQGCYEASGFTRYDDVGELRPFYRNELDDLLPFLIGPFAGDEADSIGEKAKVFEPQPAFVRSSPGVQLYGKQVASLE